MRKFLLLFLLWCSLMVNAETRQYMVLHLTSGEEVYLLQSEIPKVSFVDGQIQINAQYYNLSGVSSYTIEQCDPSAIEAVSSDNLSNIYIKDGYLILPKSLTSKDIHVYGINGLELPLSSLARQDGSHKISLQDYPDDIILVKIGTTTLKFKTR